MDFLKTLPHDVASSVIEIFLTEFVNVSEKKLGTKPPFSGSALQFCDVIPQCKGI